MMTSRRFSLVAAACVPLGALAGLASAGPVTWTTASGGNGHSYELVQDNSLSWTSAQQYATQHGGYLVTEQSAEEASFVTNLLAGANAPTGSYWIGLQKSSDGTYQDVAGQTTTFTHWAPGEPNNFDGKEDKGAIYWTSDSSAATFSRRGEWNDVNDAGYPSALLPNPSSPDLNRAGLIVERNAATAGGTASVPLPAAIFVIPAGAGIAGFVGRRMTRRIKEGF